MVVLSTMFYSVVSVDASSSFEPRLTAPASNNKYYYDGDYNLFEKYGYGMPNCTAYAYGRAYEILGTRPNLCPYNAGEWWSYNIKYGYYDYGQTPKVGAIAVWDKYDNNTGHVAVVEKVTSSTITLSESAYGGTVFFTETVDIDDDNVGYSNSYRFLGYIYILEDETNSGTADPIAPETSEKIDAQVWQVDTSVGLNMRSGAGTSYNTLVTIPDNTNISVSETKESGGYTWGKVTYNNKTGWCALDFANKIGLQYDIKIDSKLNINDAVELQLYLAAYKNLSSTQKILADNNLDNKINLSDLINIQKKLSNMI